MTELKELYPVEEFTDRLLIIDMDNTHVRFDDKYEASLLEILPPEALASQKVGEYYLEYRFEPQYHGLIHDLLRSKGFFESMEPMEGAIEAIHEMVEAGLKVKICTTPHPESDHCMPEKAYWVRKHLGHQFEEEIVLTYDKTIVYADILIDDKPEITGYMTQNGRKPFWKHVIFNNHYNEYVDTRYRMTHWKDWRKVLYPILKSLE